MKFPILSYTLLNTWDICPHQAARRYILRDLPKEVKSPEQQEGIDTHEAIERRVRHKTPLPETLQRHEILVGPLDWVRVEPEQKLGIAESGRPVGFWDDDVYLRGALDAPIIMATDIALLLDWKTGKRREEPFELEVGALLLQAHRPEIYKIYGCYIWLKEGVKGKPFDVSNTRATWDKIRRFTDEIALAVARETFVKTPGPLCGWCSVMDCQHNRNRK